MKKNIQIFKNEMFGEIRTMTNEKGETFFVGKDVAQALGYSDTQKSIRMHVDDDDKLTRQIVRSGQRRNIIFINESGLYSLILSSQLEQAKAFKRWVTSEVLPQIRMTGGYIPTKDAEGQPLTEEEIMERAHEIMGRKQDIAASRIARNDALSRLLRELPDEFTIDDVKKVLKSKGQTVAGAYTYAKRMIDREMIMGDGKRYRKLDTGVPHF